MISSLSNERTNEKFSEGVEEGTKKARNRAYLTEVFFTRSSTINSSGVDFVVTMFDKHIEHAVQPKGNGSSELKNRSKKEKERKRASHFTIFDVMNSCTIRSFLTPGHQTENNLRIAVIRHCSRGRESGALAEIGSKGKMNIQRSDEPAVLLILKSECVKMRTALSRWRRQSERCIFPPSTRGQSSLLHSEVELLPHSPFRFVCLGTDNPCMTAKSLVQITTSTRDDARALKREKNIMQ